MKWKPARNRRFILLLLGVTFRDLDRCWCCLGGWSFSNRGGTDRRTDGWVIHRLIFLSHLFWEAEDEMALSCQSVTKSSEIWHHSCYITLTQMCFFVWLCLCLCACVCVIVSSDERPERKHSKLRHGDVSCLDLNVRNLLHTHLWACLSRQMRRFVCPFVRWDFDKKLRVDRRA